MKKLKGIVLVVILLLASIMMPFNVYADTITVSNINGISITLDEVTFIEYNVYSIDGVNTQVARNYYNYVAEIQFDKSYLGNININMQYTYQARNDTGMVTYNGTKLQKVFVNGDKAYMSFGFIANSNTDPLWYNSITYSLTNSDVIEYGLISDIQQILDILQENQDIISDMYTELQTVVSNTSLSNQYLDTISKLRQYNIPFESVPINFYLMYVKKYEPVSFNTYYYWQFPFYHFTSRKQIIDTPSNNTASYDFIVMVDGSLYSSTVVTRYFEFVNLNFTYENLYRDSSLTIIKMTLTPIDRYSVGQVWSIAYNNKYLTFAPIYFNLSSNRNISTEFALQFGLSNSLLDNVQIIANGTSQSNSAASDLETSNEQMADDMDDLATIESGYNQQFNNQLQQIDFTNPLQNNAGILPAANFVITIFNGLINNNPFSVLIIVVCILLIGKKVIGK